MYSADYRSHTQHVASHRLTRALTLPLRTGKQLDAASPSAPDNYNADQIRVLADGLRDLSRPLSRMASSVEKDGDW